MTQPPRSGADHSAGNVPPAPSRRRRGAMLAVAAIIATAAGAWFGWQRHAPVAASAQAVQALQALTLPDPKGEPQALAQFNDQLLVVNFWATWCPPCVEEMPELSALQRELAAGSRQPSAQIIGIGVDSAAKIAEFADKHQITYPLLVAGAGGLEMLRSFGNDSGGLPFTVVIDEKGQIIDRISGKVDVSKMRGRLHAAQRDG